MSPTDETPWPALTIQGTFLGANLAFMFAGKQNLPILISFAILVVLFAIQATAGNDRFLYLFPVEEKSRKPMPGFDTLILASMILTSLFCFFWGASNDLVVSAVVFAMVVVFVLLWRFKLGEVTDRRIKQKFPNKNSHSKQTPQTRANWEVPQQRGFAADLDSDLVSSSAAISSVTIDPSAAVRSSDNSDDNGEGM